MNSHTKKHFEKSKAKNHKPVEIEQALTDNLNGLKALTTIHSLLHIGTFNHATHNDVASALKFVENLHTQLMDESLKHKDAIHVPQLKEVLKQREKILKKQKKLGNPVITVASSKEKVQAGGLNV